MRALLLALALVLAVASPSLAQECAPAEPEPEFTSPESGVSITGRGSDGIYYIDHDPCQLDGCLVSLWVYEETNGWAGLQRSDEVRDDTCGGAIGGDTPVL